jgi:hypothetical protein
LTDIYNVIFYPEASLAFRLQYFDTELQRLHKKAWHVSSERSCRKFPACAKACHHAISMSVSMFFAWPIQSFIRSDAFRIIFGIGFPIMSGGNDVNCTPDALPALPHSRGG